jgi:putative nucleotidyltransferase-like protein
MTGRRLPVQVEPDLMEVLREAVEIAGRIGVDYLVIGGVPLAAYLDRRATKDVDLLVRPEQAERVLEEFGRAGFETEKTYPEWLYKATKNEQLVDIIFKTRPNIRLDAEMVKHASVGEVDGVSIPLASLEDTLVMQVAAHGTESPQYWFNTLELIQRHTPDWDYLEQRAHAAPARVLSLLIYGISNGLAVRRETVNALFELLG